MPFVGDSNTRNKSKIAGITDFSYPKPFVPKNERSLWRLSFPRNESSRELSFPGTFVPGNFRSHYPIGLVAALLCVLNYCMFGCDFTLMMLTPLWTSQLTLYVGRPAFAARLSVFDVPITVSLCTKCFEVGLMSVSLSTGIVTFIHFAFLFNRKNNTNTP